MESIDYWRLCDHVSVIQAALLIVGESADSANNIGDWEYHHYPQGYSAALAALQGAILSGRLNAMVRREASNIEGMAFPDGQLVQLAGGGTQTLVRLKPDWYATLIAVDDLREWLRQRGFSTGFFFPEEQPTAAYLNPEDPCFSPKLSAAIGAWQAVKADPGLTRNKSVKSALTIWLNKHAAKYGLTKDDGTPNKQAIEDAAKVANWVTTGGAPKTPEESIPPL
ncbi:MAG TPA: hypothetical protein VMU57_06140 [Edaphobacter sp.]|uniref:hypothetical protein n=1 Tax=Edaphobacter sp. TaxID=1934404 RepID=UPI002C8432AB|nr:hypothetical protein [Edaphobacter sp.]HUZ94477.1 hypothetical protein [Edaphobacter sp.]